MADSCRKFTVNDEEMVCELDEGHEGPHSAWIGPYPWPDRIVWFRTEA